MPRHLISDAHEWINEIPTVPIYYLANPQPGERARKNQRGKKTLNTMNSSNGVNSRRKTKEVKMEMNENVYIYIFLFIFFVFLFQVVLCVSC